LEQKLDNLVTLLKSTQNPNNVSAAIGHIDTPVEYIETMSCSRIPEPQTKMFGSGQGVEMDIPLPQTVVPTQCGLVLFKGIGPPTRFSHDFEGLLDNAEISNILLNRFRDEMSPFFPFVILSPSVTADQLREQRPFLFLCVMAISCHDTAQQLYFGKQVTKQLAERMVVNTERSLDLLLGILTYMG
jgi:hypothetical protein